MAVTVPDFWNLLVASRLTSRNSLPKLEEQFAKVKGAETQGNAVTLAQWLISHGIISRYQAKVLLAGHPGPFTYGDYTVFDRHTEGRLQGAFRAIHPATRHRVMLWFHSGPAVQNKQWWTILAQQAAIFRQAVDPHVARLFQLCDLGQFKFTVLEDVQGETAQDRLNKGPIPWAIACRMVRQATEGLARLFELGQMHGAIRPENLWIDEADNLKLLLPPVARDLLDIPGPVDLSSADPASNVMRQIDYLAPEMAQPGQAPGGRTEIYALGCTLYHLLTGHPPFAGNDPLAKLSNHAGQKVPALDAAIAPPLVGQVLSIMMAKDPQRRYAHARQLVDVFTQLLAQLDPSQLEWPVSPASNKIQEYEAWLTPYGLAPASRGNELPDIAMPPILAASLKPIGGSSTMPATPTPPLPTPPGSAPARRPPPPLPAVNPQARPPESGFLSSSITGSALGAGPIITDVAPGRASPPPQDRAANKPRSANPSLPPGGNGDVARTPGTPIIAEPSAAQEMIFPPDDDFIGAITGQRRKPAAEKTEFKPEPANRKRLFWIAGAVVGCVIVAVIVWLMLMKRSPASGASEPADSAVKTPSEASTSSGGGSDAKSAPAEKSDTNAPSAEKPKTTNESKSDGQKNGTNKGAADKPSENTKKHSDPQTSQSGAAAPVAEIEEAPALWASPTHGSPFSSEYLPPRLQSMLVLRPADLLQRPGAEKIVAALGPDAQAIRLQLESLAGASMSEIQQLIVAWSQEPMPDGAWSTEPMYIIHFVGNHQAGNPNSAPANAPPANPGPAQEKTLTTFSPPGKTAQVLLVGSPEVLAEVSKLDGQPAPMNRDLEKMLVTTDDQRLATLLWSPSSYALLLGSISLSGGKWSKLLSAVRSFFESDSRAAALSMALPGDNLFLELRVRGPLEHSPDTVAKQFANRLDRLPDVLKKNLANLKLQIYGKAVLSRFPEMLQMLAEFTRAGSEGDQTVLRCYLPSAATQNLLLASELALSESAHAAAVRDLAPATETKQPETIADKLKSKHTLSFVNEPLDKTMSLLADELGVKIEIVGGDLQLDGITKNQAIRDLNERDKPASEILRDIMFKANPDGKLVYVVKPDQPGVEPVLLITTRSAAKKRGDKLPDELATPPEKK